MRRREFITLLGCAAASWPQTVRAQQDDRVRRIGVLLGGAVANDADTQERNAAFAHSLQQLGWTDGRNVRIDVRWAAGDPDRFRRYAAELVALAPDVILAPGSFTMGPLLQATRTVPIVFVHVPDPVAAGYVEGETVAIEYRWAENQFDRLPALATELVRRQVAVIVTSGGSSPALAAKAVTTTIPIVFSVAEDPVRLGLVASLARPGGTATGINFFSIELAAKRLELLRELVPAATRVALLINPAAAADTETMLRDVEAATSTMGLLFLRVSRSINRQFPVS